MFQADLSLMYIYQSFYLCENLYAHNFAWCAAGFYSECVYAIIIVTYIGCWVALTYE